jgi:hypothetical protein
MTDLQAIKRRHVEAQNKRYKDRYAYARAMGYDAIEARIVSHWSLKRIEAQAISDGKMAPINTQPTDVTNG